MSFFAETLQSQRFLFSAINYMWSQPTHNSITDSIGTLFTEKNVKN